jgi:hypothetical protein
MAPLAVALVERPAGARIHLFASRLPRRWRGARHKGYVLLTVGFFVCGFQVVFVGVHLPSYLLDKGLPAHVGVTALALIGLFNIFGTYTTGWLGGKISKKYILSAIYFGRTVVIALFLLLPLTPVSVYLFAGALGLLWLSTVPPTNGIVAQVFGVRYWRALRLHILQSPDRQFPRGVAGRLLDRTGSYAWFGTCRRARHRRGLLNLPIDEREINRGSAKRAMV